MVDQARLPGLKVGVDICSIARVTNVYEHYGEKFLKRILTENEIAFVKSSKKHFITRVAARFAAKEAVVKVLGTGWRGVGWQEVELERKPSGEPRIILHGRAQARAHQLGLSRFEVSMSHEKEYAVAFVVAY